MYFTQHLQASISTFTIQFEQIGIYLIRTVIQECQLDDSGTESDDETEKDDVDDNESEDGDLSKSISQNLSQDNVSLYRPGQWSFSEPEIWNSSVSRKQL